VHRIGLVGREARQVADLEREKEQRREAGSDEDTDPEVDHRAVHQ
jgi:hypothetical protein